VFHQKLLVMAIEFIYESRQLQLTTNALKDRIDQKILD
jgi:hypothetical protein